MPPEILAPAQDTERLIAAVEAGADAVYLGLKALNARQRGTNFTLEELARAITYCHGKGVKVYVALNTVVKERELSLLAQYMAALAGQGADGVIVQDLGVAALVKEVCPGLVLHASTQLAVHNLDGVKEAARLGFTRVILARELTAFEVREIAMESPIELEIFVHGSLCYSISGLCLTSSFLGGLSGNRGWCTQACRRPYLVRDKYRYAFSMADLSCALQGDLLRSLPVAAWKIEGRMKYPAYVRNTVAAYRAIRDSQEAQVAALIKAVKSRPFTRGFLGNADPESIVTPDIPGFTGTYAGKIRRVEGDRGEIELAADLAVGQKLRLQSAATEEGKSFRVAWLRLGRREAASARARQRVTLNLPPGAERNDLLFLVEREARGVQRLDIKAPPWQGKAHRVHAKILKALDAMHVQCDEDARGTLTLETDDLAVARAVPRGVDRVMLVLTDRLMHELSPGAIARLPVRVGVSVPPVTLPPRTEKVRNELRVLREWGVRLFEVNNVGGFGLLPEGVHVQTGPFLYVHNHAAAAALAARGSERMVFPLEGDAATLDDLKPLMPRLEVVTFAYVPLFVARAVPAAKSGHDVKDRRNELFHVVQRDGLVSVFSRRPYCVFSRVGDLERKGVRHFRLSLVGSGFASADVAKLVRRFQDRKDVAGATAFNMVYGLR